MGDMTRCRGERNEPRLLVIYRAINASIRYIWIWVRFSIDFRLMCPFHSNIMASILQHMLPFGSIFWPEKNRSQSWTFVLMRRSLKKCYLFRSYLEWWTSKNRTFVTEKLKHWRISFCYSNIFICKLFLHLIRFFFQNKWQSVHLIR